MKIYTIEEIIDLGTQVIEVYYTKEKANLRCLELQIAYNTMRGGVPVVGKYLVEEYEVLQ